MAHHMDDKTGNKNPPSRSNPRDVEEYLETVVYHRPKDVDDVKRRLTNPKEVMATKRLCEYLGLLSDNGVKATDIGTRFVSDKGNRGSIILGCVLDDDLYEATLDLALRGKEPPFQVVMDDLEQIWRVNQRIGLSRDAMNRAGVTFLKILEYSGIGNFLVGRRGSRTRLEVDSAGFELAQEHLEAKRSGHPIPEVPVTATLDEPSSLVTVTDSMAAPPQPVIDQYEDVQTQVSSGIVPSAHASYKSSDGTVILHFQPSETALQYLLALIPLLELEVNSVSTADE